MSNHITSRSKTSNYICFDRRKNLRRTPRSVHTATAMHEPKRFSHRNGIERRDTMIVYRERKQAS